MEFEKLLHFAELVNYVCNESFQGMNGVKIRKKLKYDAILDNFKTWTEAGYLDTEEGWLRRYRINEKGINEIIKITIIYIRALRNIVRILPTKQLTKLNDELEEFLAYYEVNIPLIKYQNEQNIRQEH